MAAAAARPGRALRQLRVLAVQALLLAAAAHGLAPTAPSSATTSVASSVASSAAASRSAGTTPTTPGPPTVRSRQEARTTPDWSRTDAVAAASGGSSASPSTARPATSTIKPPTVASWAAASSAEDAASRSEAKSAAILADRPARVPALRPEATTPTPEARARLRDPTPTEAAGSTKTTATSSPAGQPRLRPTAAPASLRPARPAAYKRPTAPTASEASQGERPQAAEATATSLHGRPSPDPATLADVDPAATTPTPSSAIATTAPRPGDEDQYPMYAEYPDSTANLTNNSGGEEGDVVPDPDVALRQDAADEDEDERERASLAGDDGAASADGTAQLAGEATIVETAPAAVREDEPEVGLRVAGDVSGAVAGVLDAGFEHEPLEEGVAEILDMPVEPGPDQDLRERDRLDGDVYHERERAELQLHNQGAAGKQVVIVGAALALVAQFLCLASATRRLRPGHVDVSTAVLFNVELALVVENLVFMLGVQSVGEPLRCQWVALALHYLHLVAAGWFLANTAFLAYRLRCGRLPHHFRPVAFTVWTLPAVLVSAMYAAQPRSYETHRYCWMAVQRGMLLTFVAPVTVMITINTALTLRGLRGLRARSKEEADDDGKDLVAADGEAAEAGQPDVASAAELRSSLRAAAAMLPLYSADWFLGVVAMDNSTFLTYPLLFLVSNGFLNWFLMVCAWLIVPRESNKEGGDWCGGGDGEDLDDEDELLMEDDDAGCWGKSSASDSLLRNAYGPPTVHAAHCEDWPGDEHVAVTAEPRVLTRSQSRARWGEDRGETSTYMRDVDLGPGPAGPGCAPRPSQELAEMRYDGGISTISA